MMKRVAGFVFRAFVYVCAFAVESKGVHRFFSTHSKLKWFEDAERQNVRVVGRFLLM